MPPALSPLALLDALVDRDAASDPSPSAQTTNATTDGAALQVVCAWPVSGQYGAGSRVLYYVLVAACVFARKAEWLRNGVLAAALLFPAVAALHGIVLAAVHVDGAVDMDVYGAFQLCSIGILAAPVTVRLSRTYFYDPGRNTIFVWTGLILAGLLSLTVEFYRISTSDCIHDGTGKPLSRDASFPYEESITCGLTCSVEQGPYSPMRSGSANDIYVIPAPDKLTFGTATLLAAACCIPAILSLISMWNKILEINWNTRYGRGDDEEGINEPIAGTNGATIKKMRGVNGMIRFFLSVVEIPIFGGFILAILVIGERNFFSHQVRYQIEPISSIGQWAPIVGTGLAALGSLYLLLAADVEAVKKEVDPNASPHHCNCSHHSHGGEQQPDSSIHPCIDSLPGSRDGRSLVDGAQDHPQHAMGSLGMQEVGRTLSTASSHSLAVPGSVHLHPNPTNEMVATSSRPSVGQGHHQSGDVGNRRKVAKTLTAIGNYLGTAAHDWFDDSEFKHGRALDFPEIPGEEHRNRALPQIREQYNHPRDADGHVTPMRGQRSRAGSFAASIASGSGIERSSASSRAASPHPPVRSSSRSGRLVAEQTTYEPQSSTSSPAAGLTGGRLHRSDTLEVPPAVHHSHTRNNPSASSIPSIASVPGASPRM